MIVNSETLTKYKYWDEAENEGASVCGCCGGSCGSQPPTMLRMK
jgi:hypothetical protein